MASLKIVLFGTFKVNCNGQPLPGFRYDKVRALLAYLAVENDRPHRRDELVGLFWPDSPEEDARTSLRQALAQLRAALGDSEAARPAILAGRESVQWNPEADADVDVIAFEEALKAARTHAHRSPHSCRFCAQQFTQAVERYQGDFLAHFFLPGSAPFEDWAVLKREALQRQALDTLTQLAAYHSRRGEYSQAEDCLRRLLAIEPWQEEAHRWLMRLLVLHDQRSAALAQYEACRHQLAEALGVEPQPETTKLYEVISAGEAAGALQDGHLRLPESRKHNLPPSLTPFIGREKELGALNALLDQPDHRLITLVGPGGVGKTRLALQVGAEQVACFADGVFFVPLVSVTRADLLSVVIGAVLQVPMDTETDPRQKLLKAVAGQEMLLILDNLEHLPEAAEFLSALLAAAPEMVILATSRQRLKLRGEWVFPLEGLPAGKTDAPQAGGEGSSSDLFIQSAARLNPGFAPSPAERASIRKICRLLDGLPLAIELAAAWTPVLPCAEIAREIQSNLDFLAEALSDMPTRHTSMRAVFDHSWNLLSPEEQAIFRKLSVFRGGFQREAAEQVAGAALPHLRSLLDKSLIKHTPPDRYDMHELARQYAAQQLASAAEENDARDRAFNCFLDLAQKARSLIEGEEGPAWMQRLEGEMDNIRAALEWSHINGQIEAGMRLAWAMYRFWYWRNQHVKEARHWLEVFLADAEGRSDLPTDLLGNVLYEAGVIAAIQLDQTAAEAYLGRSLAIHRSVGDKFGEGAILNSLGTLAFEQNNFLRAKELFKAGLDIDREIGQNPAAPLYNLGEVSQFLGDYATARECFEECLQLDREAHNQTSFASTLAGLARVELQLGERKLALDHYKESLQLRWELDDQEGIAYALEGLVTYFASGEPGQGDPRLASLIGGAAEKLRKTITVPHSLVEARYLHGYIASARGILGEEAFQAAWQEGRDAPIEKLVQTILSRP